MDRERELYFDATLLGLSSRYLSRYFTYEEQIERAASMLGRTPEALMEARQLAVAGPLEDLCWLLRGSPAAPQTLLTHLLLAASAPTYDAPHRQGLIADADTLGLQKAEFEALENQAASRLKVAGKHALHFPALADGMEFVPVNAGERLHVMLGLPGFLSEVEAGGSAREQNYEVSRGWSSLNLFSDSAQVLAVRWQSRALEGLGASLHLAGRQLGAHGLLRKVTVAASGRGPVQAWPTTALSVLGLVDEPWEVAREQADSHGKLLAREIMHGAMSRRPVSLCGFSLGTRVILDALVHLDHLGYHRRIQDVILLGGTAGVRHPGLDAISRVCAGRAINGYTDGDWVLSYLCRAREQDLAIGMGPLRRPAVTDVNLSKLVKEHPAYADNLGAILRACSLAPTSAST